MSASVLLRSARRQAGLTQAELAEVAGMPQSTIARLERPGANPTVAVLERALRATGVTLAVQPIATVDESQIAERRALTPAERLETFQASQRNLNRLVAGARRVSSD